MGQNSCPAQSVPVLPAIRGQVNVIEAIRIDLPYRGGVSPRKLVRYPASSPLHRTFQHSPQGAPALVFCEPVYPGEVALRDDVHPIVVDLQIHHASVVGDLGFLQDPIGVSGRNKNVPTVGDSVERQ